MEKPNRKIIIDIAVLTAVVAATFGNTLLNGFVWDDGMYLVGKVAYQQFDMRRLLFSLLNGVQYLPVRDLALVTDYALWGWRPLGFHLSNLLWYLGNVITVYLLAREVMRLLQRAGDEREAVPRFVPLVTALLFAVHPLHSEVVSWVSCRGYLTAGLFFFAALTLFFRFISAGLKRYGLYAASLACFLLSLFAMPHAIILPLLLVLAVCCCRQSERIKGYLATAPYFALAGVAYYVHKTIAVQTRVMASGTMPGGVEKTVATAIQIPFFYLSKLLWPASLSAVYDVSLAGSFAEPRVIAAFVLIFAAVGVTVCYRRRFTTALFCLFAFLIMLLPVLNIFPTSPVLADRYGYFPSFALSLFAATLLVSAGQKYRTLLRWGGVLLLLALASLTVAQNAVWRTDKALMEHAITVSPRAIQAYENLGSIYVAEGNYQKALDVYRKGNELNPFDDTYDFLQGWLHVKSRRYPQAIESFNRALARNPYSMQVLYQLGLLYEELREDDKAIDCYRRILNSVEQDLRSKFRSAAKTRLAVLLRKKEGT